MNSLLTPLLTALLQVPIDQLHIRHQRSAVREGPLSSCPFPADARRIRQNRNASQCRGCPAGARARTAPCASATAGHDVLQVAGRRVERGRGRGRGTEASPDGGKSFSCHWIVCFPLTSYPTSIDRQFVYRWMHSKCRVQRTFAVILSRSVILSGQVQGQRRDVKTWWWCTIDWSVVIQSCEIISKKGKRCDKNGRLACVNLSVVLVNHSTVIDRCTQLFDLPVTPSIYLIYWTNQCRFKRVNGEDIVNEGDHCKSPRHLINLQ